jgi:hypothetical protein
MPDPAVNVVFDAAPSAIELSGSAELPIVRLPVVQFVSAAMPAAAFPVQEWFPQPGPGCRRR